MTISIKTVISNQFKQTHTKIGIDHSLQGEHYMDYSMSVRYDALSSNQSNMHNK